MREPALPALLYMRDYACHEHLAERAERERHRVVGVRHDPDGSLWPQIITAALAGEYDVILRCPDLDPGRVPRVVFDPHPESPRLELDNVVEIRPRWRRPRRRR